jgi:hypothetical protein
MVVDWFNNFSVTMEVAIDVDGWRKNQGGSELKVMEEERFHMNPKSSESLFFLDTKREVFSKKIINNCLIFKKNKKKGIFNLKIKRKVSV